jgi:hypothetical protein
VAETGYNGWENWETWHLYTCITSDPALYEQALECIAYQQAFTTKPDAQQIEDIAADLQAFWRDAGRSLPRWFRQALATTDLRQVVWEHVIHALLGE